MARNKTEAPAYEEKTGSGKAGKVFAAMALYGIMVLLGYVVCVKPEPGTAMGAIRDVLCGLGGTFAIVIPLMSGWLATLLVLKAAGKKISVWNPCWTACCGCAC